MDSWYEWGQLNKDDVYYYDAEVQEGDDFQIYFTVSDSQSLYTYFNLYNFTDDLDLALYRDNGNENLGDAISSSLEEGDTEERIFKGLTPGDYILSVIHYADLASKTLFIFFSLGERFLFLAVLRKRSNVPFLSTDLTPALETLSFKLLFKISLLKLTFFKFGRNLLFVLLFA